MSTVESLPDHRSNAAPNYLYAVEFCDGRVKIGVTWNPRQRVVSVAASLKRSIVRAYAAPMHGMWRTQAELSALIRAGAIGNLCPGHKELFHSLKFGEATTIISQMARRKWEAPGRAPSQTPAGRQAARLAKARRAELAGAAAFGRMVADWPHPEGRPLIDVATVEVATQAGA